MAHNFKGSLPPPTRSQSTLHKTVHPRPALAPLWPPPVELDEYPSLSHSREPEFSSQYQVSTHVFPAAWPRCTSAHCAPPPLHQSKDEMKKRIAQTVPHFIAVKEAQERDEDTRPFRGEILWTVANRYVRTVRSPTRGLTLVFLHCIGTHKETWEPVIRRLLDLLDAHSPSIHIEECWTLDSVQHGDSGLANERVMGDTFDCADNARDLASFLLSYLPEDVSEPGILSTNLARLSQSETDRRMHNGIHGRTIVGVGHSIGACSFVYPAIQYPALFSSLVMVESFTIPEFIKHLDTSRKNETICMAKRWTWSSREEAVRYIKSNPYYRHWDPKAIEAFIDFGIVELDDRSVRTKSHPLFEALMLFERRVVYETWERLEEIDPRIAMHWVWGGRSPRQGGAAVQAQTSFRRSENTSNDYHPKLNHLLTQEAPDILGQDIFRFLAARYEGRRSKL